MAKHTRYPENTNPLMPTKYQFVFARLPKLTYFCQRANLPGIELATAIQSSPMREIPRAGSKIEYDDLKLTFLVDEQLESWLEIFSWIRARIM